MNKGTNFENFAIDIDYWINKFNFSYNNYEGLYLTDKECRELRYLFTILKLLKEKKNRK